MGTLALFELEKQEAKLLKYNARLEVHGKEEVPAADLKLEVNLPSEHLAMFADTLRWSLYHKADSPSDDLADKAHEAPNRRYPKLGPIPWNLDLVGAELVIDRGLGGTSDLVIDGCKVNKFFITPLEGGTVKIHFTVQCRPDEKQRGILTGYGRNKGVTISLTPPDVAEQPEADKPRVAGAPRGKSQRGGRGRASAHA